MNLAGERRIGRFPIRPLSECPTIRDLAADYSTLRRQRRVIGIWLSWHLLVMAFRRPQLPCGGDPPRKTTVWRKRASQLLLISEHDVRVHPRCAPRRQPTGNHRHCRNRRDHKGDRHGICRLHAKQQGRNQPI